MIAQRYLREINRCSSSANWIRVQTGFLNKLYPFAQKPAQVSIRVVQELT